MTTVAFYDTLGVQATLYMMEQTEVTTMAVSIDYVSKLAQMKIDDASAGKKMQRLKNLIVFDDEIRMDKILLFQDE